MLSSQIKKNCGFDEDALDYIYGEMAGERRGSFESHLVDCDTCIGELAAVSEAKFEVYEWRKLAFEPLATPVIEIPYDMPAAAQVSFAERITVFVASISRVWAIGGLAAASLVIGLWLTFSAAVPNNDAVVVAGGENSMAPVGPDKPPVPQSLPFRPEPVTVAGSTRRAEPKAASPVRTTVAGAQSKPSRIQVAKVPLRKDTNRSVTVPTLSGYSADEDSSLRLAEVFDDIGGM